MRKKLLWIGDAACDSGFARCTEKTIPGLIDAGWDVAVIGLNYRGDPHPFRTWLEARGGMMFPAYVVGGPRDLMGASRIPDVMAQWPADAVVIQNDPWNIPNYIAEFDKLKSAHPVLIGAIAVDGKNCRGHMMNGLDHAIFWTEFAREEAEAGGFFKGSSVVPLGVDLDLYKPGDRMAAREAIPVPEPARSGFIVLNANRNQPRKRIDLTIEYFAEFFHTHCPRKDAYLYLHVCPTGEVGVDVNQLAGYYGLKGHVLLEQPGVYKGLSEADLVLTYQASDVQISTTQGEGWGLTTMEGLACGVPQLVPDWSALGEWARGAALLAPCGATSATIGGVNALGGIPDKRTFVEMLRMLYHSPCLRQSQREAGLALVANPRFRWDTVATSFAAEVDRVVQGASRNAFSQVDRREGDAGQAGSAASPIP